MRRQWPTGGGRGCPAAVVDRSAGVRSRFATRRPGGPVAAAGDHRAAARADRQRRGLAGQPDRSWGVAGVGGPQRRGGAVRRPGARRLLDPRRTAVGPDDPVQREHRAAIEGPASRSGSCTGPQGVSTASGAVAATGSWSPGSTRCAAADRLPSVDGVLKGMGRTGRRYCGCWSGPRCRCTPTSARPSAGLREEAEDQRRHAERVGPRARDTFASLKKTCRSLGVNFWGVSPSGGFHRSTPFGGVDLAKGGGSYGLTAGP